MLEVIQFRYWNSVLLIDQSAIFVASIEVGIFDAESRSETRASFNTLPFAVSMMSSLCVGNTVVRLSVSFGILLAMRSRLDIKERFLKSVRLKEIR